MQVNKIYNMDWLNNSLSDKCVDLIIADPPYFEVKGKFDFIWKTFEDYLIDVEKWAVECKRILKDSGTLFLYGNSKKIAYSQIIFDKYFKLENSIIWRKKDSIQYQYYSVDLARSFTTHNERLLMYSTEVDLTGLEVINEKFIKPKNPFSLYLRDEFTKAKVTNKQISKLFPSKTGGLTGCVSNWINGDNVITEEQYLLIRRYLNGEYLRKEYEDLRKEYEDQRRYFYNLDKLDEVFEFSQEAHKTKLYVHPTKKSENLTAALINTCSKIDDLLVIPFVGSGTECAVSLSLQRNYIGFELNPDYIQIAEKRIYQAWEKLYL